MDDRSDYDTKVDDALDDLRAALEADAQAREQAERLCPRGRYWRERTERGLRVARSAARN